MNLKRLVAMAILACVALPAAAEEAPPPFAGGIGKFTAPSSPVPAPAASFTTLDGAPAQLADFHGKVVLVNLWATWCAPCIEEMPSLDRLQAKLGGKDFTVLALSSDRAGACVVRPILEKCGTSHLAVYLDPKGTATRLFKARGLPTTILIGRDGTELGRIEGEAHWDSPAAEALIRWALDRPGGAAQPVKAGTAG
jgi:thiol-disulfide isomerase/thioredoxin